MPGEIPPPPRRGLTPTSEALLQMARDIDPFSREEPRGYKTLPVLDPPDLPRKRRIFTEKFKMEYDTIQDIHLRLLGTVIFIGDQYYYVRDIVNGGSNGYQLIVQDKAGVQSRIGYNHPSVDCRSPEPQYIQMDRVGFLMRYPARQQHQGLHRNNVRIKYVGENATTSIHDPSILLPSFRDEVLPWDMSLHRLMESYKAVPWFRLSSRVAVWNENDKLKVEYRGRYLGELKENSVLVDEDDYSQQWIRHDLQKVGLSVKEDKHVTS